MLQYRPRGPGGTSASDVVTRPPKPALMLSHGGPRVNVDYREWAEPTCGGLSLSGKVDANPNPNPSHTQP